MIFDGEFLFKNLEVHQNDRQPSLTEQLVDMTSIFCSDNELSNFISLFTPLFTPILKSNKSVSKIPKTGPTQFQKTEKQWYYLEINKKH